MSLNVDAVQMLRRLPPRSKLGPVKEERKKIKVPTQAAVLALTNDQPHAACS